RLVRGVRHAGRVTLCLRARNHGGLRVKLHVWADTAKRHHFEGRERCIVVVPRRACVCILFFFQAEDGIRDLTVTGVQTCALPISRARSAMIVGVMYAPGSFAKSRVKLTDSPVMCPRSAPRLSAASSAFGAIKSSRSICRSSFSIV